MLYTRKSGRRPNWPRIIGAIVVLAVIIGGIVLGVNYLPGMLSGDNDTSPTPVDTSPTPGITPSAQPQDSPDPSDSTSPDPSQDAALTGTRTFTLSAVGDIMTHSAITQAARSGNGYDYAPFFQWVKEYVSGADIALGALNAPITDAAASDTNAPLALAQALNDAGFDAMALCGDMMLGQGATGVGNSATALNDAGIKPAGAGDIAMLKVNDLNIAVLSFAQGVKDTPEGYESAIRLLNDANIAADMQKAKDNKADIIIAYIHGDSAAGATTGDEQKAWAKKLGDAGAHIVLGAYGNVAQGMEYIDAANADGSTRKVLVAYSLGDFLSHFRTNNKDCGIILNLTVTKDMASGVVSVTTAQYMPTYILRYSSQGKYHFEILPAADYSGARHLGMNNDAKARAKKVYETLTTTIGTQVATPIPMADLLPESLR